MSNRDSCTHHFEHVKQTRPFTEREYMQCAKCGLRNPLGLFQHWDTERDGTPVFAKYSDSTGPGRNIKKGRSSGPHLQWVKNTTGKIEDIITREEWDKANPPLRPDSSYGANYIHRRYGPNRSPIVKVKKTTRARYKPWSAVVRETRKSKRFWVMIFDTWEEAYKWATHHAHNHHRSQK